MLKNTLKILKYIVIGILLITLLSNFYLIIMKNLRRGSQPHIFGLSTALVVSGSMEPVISVDDIVVIKKQDSYEKGDIISFSNGKNLYTHRIVEITDDGYVTKGDANNTEDKEIAKVSTVSGRVIFVIPKIGSVVYFLRSPLGIMLIILFIFGVLLIPDKKDNDDEEKQTEL